MSCFDAGLFKPRLIAGIVAVCLIAAAGLAPVPAVAADDEIGVPSGSNDIHPDFPPLDFEVGASAGYALFLEDDMSDTYDGLATYGLELSAGLSGRTRLFLGGRYGKATGDPLYGEPEFQSGVENELTAVPLLVGVRTNLSQYSRLHVYLGAAFVATWFKEASPSVLYSEQLEMDEYDGWATGFLASIQPQWRSADDDLAISLELGFGGASGNVSSGYSRHEVNTVGISARLTIAKGL